MKSEGTFRGGSTSLLDGETTVRIEPEQANEIANMAADKAADRLVENFR